MVKPDLHDRCPKCGARKMIQSKRCRACYVADCNGRTATGRLSVPERIALVRAFINDAQISMSTIHCGYDRNPQLALESADNLLRAMIGARGEVRLIFLQLSRAVREAAQRGPKK